MFTFPNGTNAGIDNHFYLDVFKAIFVNILILVVAILR